MKTECFSCKSPIEMSAEEIARQGEGRVTRGYWIHPTCGYCGYTTPLWVWYSAIINFLTNEVINEN